MSEGARFALCRLAGKQISFRTLSLLRSDLRTLQAGIEVATYEVRLAFFLGRVSS